MNITTKSDITEVTVKLSKREAELLFALFSGLSTDTFINVVNAAKFVRESHMAAVSRLEAYDTTGMWYHAFNRAIGPKNGTELSDTPS